MPTHVFGGVGANMYLTHVPHGPPTPTDRTLFDAGAAASAEATGPVALTQLSASTQTLGSAGGAASLASAPSPLVTRTIPGTQTLGGAGGVATGSARGTPALSGGAVGSIVIGAAVMPYTPLSYFDAAYDLIGPLTIARRFAGGMPTTVEAGSAAHPNVRTFFSFKGTSIAHLHDGTDDAAIRTLALSAPAGTYMTCYHEPENNMSGDTFCAIINHVYQVVKAANPGVMFGTANMAYQWGTLHTTGLVPTANQPAAYRQTPDHWVPDYCDFFGVDVYSPQQPVPTPLSSYQQWLNWFNFFDPIATERGIPLVLAEYGAGVIPPGGLTPAQQAAMEANRIIKINADRVYWANHRNIKMILLWDGTGAAGDWVIHDTAGQTLWKDVSTHLG